MQRYIFSGKFIEMREFARKEQCKMNSSHDEEPTIKNNIIKPGKLQTFGEKVNLNVFLIP